MLEIVSYVAQWGTLGNNTPSGRLIRNLENGTTAWISFASIQDMSSTIDILRNEKPVYYHVNVTTHQWMLSTGPEPVGEGEGSKHDERILRPLVEFRRHL